MTFRSALAALLLVVSLAAPCRADGLITPFIGYDFGGDAGECPSITSCSSKQLSWGGALGFMVGGVIGMEFEAAFAPHFFGESGELSDNKVVTVMGNVIAGIPLGAVRPYAVGGFGVMNTDISGSSIGVVKAFNDNSFTYDIGGGMFVFFSQHVGLRLDLRMLHTLEDVPFTDVPVLEEDKLLFWRGTLGLTLRF